MRRAFSTAQRNISRHFHPFKEGKNGSQCSSCSLLASPTSHASSNLFGNAAEVSHGAQSRPRRVSGPKSPANSRAPFQLFTFNALCHCSCRDPLTAIPSGRFSSSGAAAELREKLRTGPGLGHFIARGQDNVQGQTERVLPSLGGDIGSPSSRLELEPLSEQDLLEEYVLGSEEAGQRKRGKVYFETFGCQMNVNDMEIVLSIMAKDGYDLRVDEPAEADVIFVNTCAIRENAESKVWHRLNFFRHIKTNWHREGVGLPGKDPPKVAVLGCMAERLKTKLIDSGKMVDVVCGPDAYRDLPRLLAQVDSGQAGVNVMLSLEETYADVSPVRIARDSPSAFVSIMRGCDNMCSYCIVPFTRGRERSRPTESIVREVRELAQQGIKEVILLGQNVNSYRDFSAQDPDPAAAELLPMSNTGQMSNESSEPWSSSEEDHAGGPSTSGGLERGLGDSMSEGFATIYRPREGGARFTQLLGRLSTLFPEIRFSFTSPHPKDFPDDLIFLIRDRPNICKLIHLPAQSGSSRVLERMRRGYSREAYLALVERIRSIIPNVAITSDFITGFCGETEEEHGETLSLVEAVGYDMAYMFAYSMRERTHAHRRLLDDVPEDVKRRRLAEVIETFRCTTLPRYTAQLGQTQVVLVERRNKRNPLQLVGKSNGGHRVIFSDTPVPDERPTLPAASSEPTSESEKAHRTSSVEKEPWSLGTKAGGEALQEAGRGRHFTGQVGSKAVEWVVDGTSDGYGQSLGSTNGQGQGLVSTNGQGQSLGFGNGQGQSLGWEDEDSTRLVQLQVGDFVRVKIDSTSTASLFGTPIARTTLAGF